MKIRTSKAFIKVLLALFVVSGLLTVTVRAVYNDAYTAGYAQGANQLDDIWSDVYRYGFEAGLASRETMNHEKAPGCTLWEI